MISDPRHWSLGTKLPLTMAIVVVAVSLAIGLVMVIQERGRIRADLEQSASREAYSIAANAAEAITRADYWALFKTLERVVRNDYAGKRQINAGVILDKQGVIMAALDPPTFPVGLPLAAVAPALHEQVRKLITEGLPRTTWGEGEDGAFVQAVHPIEDHNHFVGVVILRLSATEVSSSTGMAAVTILGMAAALAAIGSAVGAYISNRMIRPLQDLAGAMERVAHADQTGVPQVDIRDYDEIGRLVQSFHDMARNLEEKRALERELATAEKLAALGGIAAGVAHEINNPLAGMLNCIDTLEKYPQNRALVDRYIPLIKKGLHRIHSIVRGLLAELRVEDDGHWGSSECLDDIRELIAAETEGRSIRLEWTNQLGCDTHLQCQRIQQVVFNLMKNAVQAVEDGGRVAFRAYRRQRQVVFEVEDDGVGIPAENLSRLFDPFFTSKPNGTGLGLWTAYRIVQGMGGILEVESEPGQGSLFRIRLPETHGVIERQENEPAAARA